MAGEPQIYALSILPNRRNAQKSSFSKGKCSMNNHHLSIINNHCALGTSTTVERALQISPFLTNKANFRKSQMNVNNVLTKDYENKTLGGHGKN